ncbi:galectin-1 isoform X1 [Apteryx rowi]|uniref:galectin-1 isoform X1 n=1 Tax=Apteryx rowi TaxID=308060 RepID=UPI000E1DA8B1|nr:galectin-1 isoform X1 [Apteryx rowi]
MHWQCSVMRSSKAHHKGSSLAVPCLLDSDAVLGTGPVCTNLGLKPGQRLTVKGKTLPNAKSFVMNLGKDSNHLGLHFNPRFDAHGDVNTIVCNSKKVEEWGTEHRETVFPFQKGAPIEISFAINPSDVTVHLPGHQFTFPNRLGLQVFDYFDAQGDFTLQSLSWE